MKRILIFNDRVTGGGAEAVMRDIVLYLHDRYEITITTLDDDCQSFRNIFPANVRYIRPGTIVNSYSRLNPVHYVVSLYNHIRLVSIFGRRYDIVIANKEGICMQYISKMRAGRKLAWVHGDYRYSYYTYRTFPPETERKCMQQFDHVVCVSQAAADSVRQVIGDPENLCVRYNPIDYSKVLKNAEQSVQIKRDETKPLFVAVGRFAEQKNFITLAKVCARLDREFDFELWIVGDGEQRKDVERILNEEKCGCVKLLGMQSNPHQFLAKADFLISTSLGESYGLVFQEALILGVPILATRCPAIEECVNSRFGLFVDCDEASVERGMRFVLENPEYTGKCKERIKKEFEIESLWESRQKKIEELIAR